MEPGPQQRTYRTTRANGHVEGGSSARRAHHTNKRWVAESVTGRSNAGSSHTGSDTERWERGGHRGGGRGRPRGSRGKFGNASVTFRRNGALDGVATGSEGEHSEMEEEHQVDEMDSNEPETPEERESFWQELVKARETERKKAIAEGKMDDPHQPKRLEDAITMVGTCMDMCPRFERYRRERENNLFEWETIPHTKRVDHKRAVKAYERAAGDKTLPSDLRPPDVLKMGPIAIECHGRCARFHILAIHVERDRPHFSITMEEQQLMNTLQSLKEFYLEQRGHYQSPTELEIRVYHRLIHIRDQKERHDDIPQALLNNPVFKLTTKFRARVQAKSAPITKTSPLVVDAEAMHIFAELAGVLRREGNVVMTYLVACILERHFGKDTIEDIESIRGDLSFSDIVDGYTGMGQEQDTDIDVSVVDETEDQVEPPAHASHESPTVLQPSGTQWLTDPFGPNPTQSAFFNPPAQSAFSNLKTIPNAFGTTSFGTQSPFTNAGSTAPAIPAFGPIKDNNAASAPGSLPHRVTEASGTSTSSSPPFIPTPAGSQSTTFALQAEQSSSIPTVFPSQATQPNGFTFGAAVGSEASPSKSLNPLAPTFTPKPMFTTPTSSAFGITPPNNVRSLTENRQPSVPTPISKKASISKSRLTRERSMSDAVMSEMPFVSSPPSMDSTSLEGEIGQTPPSQPPHLNRRQPISLPPTPTATMFIPSSLPSSRKSSLKNIQTSCLSAVPTEILSPLVIHSPVTRSSMPALFRRESLQSPLKPVVSAADIEAEAEPPVEKLNTPLVTRPPPAEKLSRKATALHFARRGWLVKQAFCRWQQRFNDQVKWIEACRRSTRYKEKVQAERLSRSVGGSPPKRLRVRLSGEYRPPANDEELARRFEKNHEEHALRWARGSFLGVLRDFLESTSRPLPDDWSAWLSLNQESDGTAIWLEQKFNVPDSGQWKNENIFQIPISRDHVELAHSYPGVVIFERTPLTGVTDILGRKYRVLEDCTRLREILEAFPADRHYIPSLLCIAWSERDPDSSKDFDDMVGSMMEGNMLTSAHELLISTAALDMESKLEELLHVIPFDLEGRLVKRVSLNDLFKIWEHEWEETTTSWLGNCIVYGEFNWDLYAKLLQGCTRFLIQVISSVTGLLRDGGAPSDLGHLQLGKDMDSGTTFDAVLHWLQALPKTETTVSLIGDIRAHRNLGRDFPTMTFLSQLYALARSVAAYAADVDPEATQFVSRSRLADVSREAQRLKAMFEEEMNAFHIAKLKPSKRLASFAETSSSRGSTPRLKKQRVSLSDELPTDEETSSRGSPTTSPSLSSATSVPSEPTTIVTPAMLRSLTKDIRAKYGVA
ncbi:hypothetical protein EV363DRAFT_1400231 [Boletus edulis]|nr:hypothetical protein EV363DRAFT_1400231 [Boletus edulis]